VGAGEETQEKAVNDWRAGFKRVPLHLATWGLAGAVASLWLGWLPTAFVVGAAIRGEYQDVVDVKSDTWTKAVIDLISQVALPVLSCLILHHFGLL
jgi:hypothetical protein